MIANPHAGHNANGAPLHEQITTALAALGVQTDVVFTTLDDEGTGLAQAAVAAGYSLIIAAGGDGTIEAVAKGVLGSAAALGIIPAGTQNNVAHSLHVPADLDAACAIIARGQRHAIDLVYHYWRAFLGQATPAARVDYHRARNVRITSRHALPIAIDGTLSGPTPISLTIAPQRLTVMLPRNPVPSQPPAPIQRIWNAIAPS